MRSEPGHDQPAAGPAAAQPGASRAGQVAVVTGGSAGLGLAIATALAQAGTDVVLAQAVPHPAERGHGRRPAGPAFPVRR